MPTQRPPTQFDRPFTKKPARSTSTEQMVISEHLADLRGRVRLLTWISGLCCTVLALFGGMLITGLLDWMLHFDDSGTRLILGLSLLGLSAWVIWRQLIVPLRIPLSGAFLASRVERRFPGLKNRVLSAVEFLEHRLDAKLGSTELQQSVVGQALDDLHRIEPSDVIETKAVRNVTIAGALVCGLAAVVVMLHPLEAATSVQRLMFPFATVPWPRAVELKLVRPDLTPVIQAPDRPILIARGDTLELYVENSRGRLPERVWFEYRMGDDGPIIREPLRLTTLRDEKGQAHEAAMIDWTATRGTMQFRASGGDDNVMPFYQVEVVPPPNVESLQVTVTPPPYSRQSAQILPPGVGHVQGLLGTKVDVTATSDKLLKSAKLRIGEQPGIPLVIDEDQLHFAALFEIKEAVAGNYWFELTDTQGFTDREAIRYDLRGMADSVPDVSIEAPATDVLLTADAELPVEILAKDDLGLREVRITFQVGDEEKLRLIPLYDRESAEGDDLTPDAALPPGTENPLGPQRHQANYLWKMADLDPEPGTRIVFRAEATDDYDLGQPHLGKSIPRTITIVSRGEKQKELAARVGDLLDDLQQATELQKRARQQTQELQTQLDKVGEFRPQDLDQLQRAELDQRQTASRLGHPADGVETQARQLLNEFRANGLNDEGTEQRLERLANELGRLERDELPDAEQALSRAQKFAEEVARQKSGDNQPSASGANSVGNRSAVDKKGKNVASEKDRNPPSKSNRSTNPEESQQSQRTGPADDSSGSPDSKPETPQDSGAKDAMPTTVEEEKSSQDSSAGKPETTFDNPTSDASAPSQQSTTTDAKEQGANQSHDEKTPSASSEAARKSLRSSLNEAQSQQTRSLESLTELRELLAEWRDRRDVSKDLSLVISEQEKVQQDVSEMAQQTLSKSSTELSPQEKAELNKLAGRQRRIAEQLDQFRKQVGKAADSLQKNDPDSAEKLNEIQNELKQQATASDLEQAADDIAENRMGDAAEVQQKAADALRDIERMMKRQPNEDTEQFLMQTQEALQEFQQLRDEQQNLADQAQELNQQEESLEKKQQQNELMEKQAELEERMAKAERKLERLRLRGAAEAAHRARKRLNEMMKDVQEADDGEEMQQAMEEALDDLEQVERELVLEKRIAQERLAFEQLEKIEGRLKTLRARQETVIEETVRLDEARLERETLTRGQLKTLKDLAETERSLQAEAEQLGQQMVSAEVFSLVLKRLGRSMKLAADSLGERQTAAATQSLERDALRKIDNLLAVLVQEQKKPEPKQPPAEQPEELAQEPQKQEEKPEEAQPPGDMLPQLAQLKLLKSLQEEYLERTEMLNKFRDKDGNLPESMMAEKNELALEQVELADFARNLIAKFLQQQPDRQGMDAREAKSKERRKDDDATKVDP